MAISKIKVGSTEHELQTTIANVSGLQDALDDKATKSEGIFFIEGTGTTAGTWKGTSDRITSYYDGLTIKYKISIAGASTTTLNINNLGAKTVYRFNTTKLTTQFPVGSIITLTYHADLNGGCWITNDYDSNSYAYQRVYETSTNAEYPITTRYNTTDGSSYYTEYGRYTNGVTLNPSTNTITASTFKGNLSGTEVSAQSITANEELIVNEYLIIPHDDDVAQGCYIFDESPSATKPVLGFLGNNGDETVILRYIAAPEESYDAANKQYVDDAVANAGGGSSGGSGATLDKVYLVDTWAGDKTSIDYTDDEGISWDDKIAFYNSEEDLIVTADVYHRIPLLAGDNVAFTKDQENQVVKVNAIVDTKLSSISTNPVQNKVISAALNNTVSLDGDQTIQGNITIGSDSNFIEITPTTTNELRIKNMCLHFDDGDNIGTYIWGESSSEEKPVVAFYGSNADEPTILRNIATPEERNDATNKQYVDDAINKLEAKSIDKLEYIDTYFTDTRNIVVEDNGIKWEDECELVCGNAVGYGDIYQKVPIVPGNNINFVVDEENQVVKINASASSGTSQLQIPITYYELKKLRDNSQLIPGAFYRITDYQCTTVQENTRAMDNKFDIIVQALSENTLSENASADYHGGEDSNAFKLDSFTVHYTIFEDFVNKNETLDELYPGNGDDKFIAYSYEANDDGDVVPVIYKTNMVEYENEPDYQDAYYYVGTETYDGVLYDKWRMINEDCIEDGPYWDASTGYKYILTDRIVENNEIIDSVKERSELVKHANIPAWEIKYCLDNDNTRFAWALDGQAITNLGSSYSNGATLIRKPSFDNGMKDYAEYANYIYAWGTQGDADDGDIYNFIYSKTEIITSGDIVFNASEDELQTAEVAEGKGVIYYMKDEHGNECPYDFKNIQFKRDVDWQNEHIDFIESLGISVGDVGWFYTFSWINENLEVDDLTLRQDLTDDGGAYAGTYLNKISPVLYETALELNNNIFINSYQYDGGIFYGCHSNTFGNDCYNNTFGNGCYNNTFGNECYNNTFGSDCFNNTFENDCSSNTFGNYCTNNTFGNDCDKNAFGKECYHNTFGNDCSSSTFGNYCDYNTFGNGCYNNTFGNECYNNTFGISCYNNVFNIAYIRSIKFANSCQFIKFINEEASGSSNYIQDITISAGVRGTRTTPLELQVSRNAAPVVYEAAGTTHIILD